MRVLKRLLGLRPSLSKAAEQAHAAVMSAALEKSLYADGAAQDTLEGRFDMLTVFAALSMRRLRELGEDGRDLAQALFDRLMSGVDHALRETGTGDLRVGKKIRLLGETFYGQARALDAALDAQVPRNELNDFFDRNGPHRTPEQCRRLSERTLQAWHNLSQAPADALLAGRLPLGAPLET